MQTNTEIINKLFQESISNELNKMGKIKFDDYNRTIKVFLDRQYIPLNVISLLRELFLRLHGEDNNYTEKKIKDYILFQFSNNNNYDRHYYKDAKKEQL